MDENKFEVILNSLLKRTQNNELNWKTTANSNTYLLVLTDSSITIQNIGDIVIEFRFRNEKGETVESKTVRTSNEENSSKAYELYYSARRRALNSSDETINKIIKQLNPESFAA